MSRTIHSYAVRTLALAGFLGVATLVAPSAIHAQISSPDRALLNTTAAASYSEVTIAASPSSTVNGESALLGRSAFGISSQPKLALSSLGEARLADGERALLNKVAPTPRRLVLAQ